MTNDKNVLHWPMLSNQHLLSSQLKELAQIRKQFAKIPFIDKTVWRVWQKVIQI